MGNPDQDTGLAEWRQNNWKRILEKVESTLIGVIDNKSASIKDKNEAARTLARMANILTPEKVEDAPHKGRGATPWWSEELSDDERQALDTILNPPKA